MILTDEFYILQNNKNPIMFLDANSNQTQAFRKALRAENRKSAEIILEEYNEKTRHLPVDDFHVVKVKVTYDF